MSRIDEALRRASTRPPEGPAAAPEPSGSPVEAEPALSDSPAVPWDLPLQGSDQSVDEPVGFHLPVAEVLASSATPSVAPFGGFDPRLAEKLVGTAEIRPVSIEQYRRLAATLHHAQAEKGIKVVMVASAMTGEGKTLTATNLALTLSQSYRRQVLLIDADLRRPALHEVFRAPNVFGLSDGLKAAADQQLSLIQVSSHLSVLTAGRPDPDPMSGLTSERMRHIIREAAEKFDWVIIDTPAVGLLPDANLLAAMVDVALLVVSAGQTPCDAIQRAVSAVGRDRVLGVVLNRAEDGPSANGYYADYYEKALVRR